MARKNTTKEYHVYDDNGTLDVTMAYDSISEAEKDIESYFEGDTYAEGVEVVILEVVKRGTIMSPKVSVEWHE